MEKINVLFTQSPSNYDNYNIFETWDINRNAFLCDSRSPSIYHPPCRLFSRLRKFSTAPVKEKQCAFFSLARVRQFGGILEHPRSSTLWKNGNFDLTGQVDIYGGFLRSVNLSWFGFPCEKKTMLYFVGIKPGSLPPFPINLQPPTHVISSSSRSRLKELSSNKRSLTPVKMIDYFITVIKIMHNESD